VNIDRFPIDSRSTPILDSFGVLFVAIG
jgi:hypothetical protein